jgi:hypothetical protein
MFLPPSILTRVVVVAACMHIIWNIKLNHWTILLFEPKIDEFVLTAVIFELDRRPHLENIRQVKQVVRKGVRINGNRLESDITHLTLVRTIVLVATVGPDGQLPHHQSESR